MSSAICSHHLGIGGFHGLPFQDKAAQRGVSAGEKAMEVLLKAVPHGTGSNVMPVFTRLNSVQAVQIPELEACPHPHPLPRGHQPLEQHQTLSWRRHKSADAKLREKSTGL
jgi:hypothetical protein